MNGYDLSCTRNHDYTFKKIDLIKYNVRYLLFTDLFLIEVDLQ